MKAPHEKQISGECETLSLENIHQFFDNRNHFAYKSILLLNIKKDYLGLGSIPLYFYRKIYCQLNVDLFRSAGFLIE